MARERIEPGAGAPSQAKTEKRELPSRRDFLKLVGILVVGGAVAAPPALRALRAVLENLVSVPSAEVLAADKGRVEVVRDEVEKYDVNVDEVTNFLSSQGIGSETSIELHLLDESFKELWGGTHAREMVGCRHGKCEETHSYFIEFYMKDDLKDFVLPKEYGENVLKELEGVEAWNWVMGHSLYHVMEIEKTGETTPDYDFVATQFANENYERPFFIEKETSGK